MYNAMNVYHGLALLGLLLLIALTVHTRTRHAPLIHQRDNRIPHLDDCHSYAHYSLITQQTRHQIDPAFRLTLTLSAGQALRIPRHWWHWVRSEGRTIAVNFWLSDVDGSRSPVVKPVHIPTHWTDEHLLKTFPLTVTVWNQRTGATEPEVFRHFQASGKPDHYVITLPAYSQKLKGNETIPLAFKDDIEQIGRSLSESGCTVHNANIWLAYSAVDTGLHYDDQDGWLVVVSGTKTVELFPPSQTPLLKAISVEPVWVKLTPNLRYNVMRPGRDKRMLLRSAALLYQSLKCAEAQYNVRAVMDSITRAYQSHGTGKIVWGIKHDLDPNVHTRWELYLYRLHYRRPNPLVSEVPVEPAETGFALTQPGHVITSLDLEVSNPPEKVDSRNRWYVSREMVRVEFPFWGNVRTVRKGQRKEPLPHSWFVIDTQVNIRERLHEVCARLELTDVNAELVSKYECLDVAVYHKRESNELGIQYLGISVNDFVLFLHEFRWPQEFIRWYLGNREEFALMENEVTINYRRGEQNEWVPARSSVYGLL